MKLINIYSLLFVSSMVSCQNAKLVEIASFPKEIKEISAAESLDDTLIWTLEDHGNKPQLFALNLQTNELVRAVTVTNAKNKDWEDLTKDVEGNLYIGDFGNNKGKRKTYRIYKVIPSERNTWEVSKIEFTLPKKIQHSDFEAFFYFNEFFYAFTKENGKASMIKIDSKVSNQKATIVTTFNLKGSNNKITSAAINDQGTEVILLNHDKIWKLSDFEGDQFFSGVIEQIYLNHDSQKEGICFGPNNTIYIADERNNFEGCNVYKLELPKQ